MHKIIILYLILFIYPSVSFGQKANSNISAETKMSFSTKEENIKWILEKLNTYGLNNIAFKCNNRVYDKSSNFNASFDEVTNQLIIKYEYADTINSITSSFINKIPIQSFKRIEQAKYNGCENEKYFKLETKSKCIEVKIVSTIKGQTFKNDYSENKIHFYFDAITEKDILAKLNTAILNLKQFEQR